MAGATDTKTTNGDAPAAVDTTKDAAVDVEAPPPISEAETATETAAAPEDVAITAALGGSGSSDPAIDNNGTTTQVVVDVESGGLPLSGVGEGTTTGGSSSGAVAEGGSSSTGSPPPGVVSVGADNNNNNDDAPDKPRPINPVAELGRTALVKAGESVRHVGTKSRELAIGTQIAAAAATASTVQTLGQIGSNPLIASGEDGDVAGHKVKGEESDGFVTRIHQYGIQGLSVATFVSAMTSMIMIVGHLVDFSSLLTLVLSPLVFWQKTKLQQLGGMRGQQNDLRHKVNFFTSENSKLTASIDSMEQTAKELQHVEKELDDIAMKAGGQVDRLVNIVHENGQIQAEIKEILDDEILQQIITAVVMTDRDQDYILNKREVRQLEYRLKNIPGVTFHHDRFQAFVASDKGDLTLSDVCKIARNLQDPTIPNDKRVFEYTPKKPGKKKSMLSSGSILGGGSRRKSRAASVPANVTGPTNTTK